MPHKIAVGETLSAKGIELSEFRAEVTVNIIPASGDGWNEPREPSHAELSAVTQIDGPHIQPSKLAEWAEAWVEGHQNFIKLDILNEQPF